MDAPDEQPPPLWEVVPLEAYEIPADTQSNLVRRRWRSLGRWLRVDPDANEDQVHDEADLQRLPQARLETLVPPLDWAPGAEALRRVLTDESTGEAPVAFLVGSPHGDHAELLDHWATRHGARVLEAPTAETLLAGAIPWKPGDARTPWVIPRLEWGFLRQTVALAGLRLFLEAALAGRLGRGVIGCDSWTWSYLQHTLALPSASAYTLQAFDGERLARLFGEAARRGAPVPTIRSVRSGEPVLGDDDAVASRDLRQLAAHCRGQPGLAWHYWRSRLRTGEGGEADASGEQALWLAESLDEVVLPAEVGEEAVLLLHALLLHGGLPEALLSEVLPFSFTQALSGLRQLQARGAVACREGRWQVTPLGYVNVRYLLEERAYLVDAL